MTPIDIRNKPDLLRLVEEVKTTRTPRLLQKDRETLAVIMPVETSIKRAKARKYHPTAYEAIKATVGSWKDIDTDALIADLYRARQEGSRPPSRP